jgi:hypothetical protein
MTSVEPISVIERHGNKTPVPIYEIIFEMGVEFAFQAMPDNVSGWIERLPSGKYKIAVNSNHPSTRQRFTAAHELGHYIYHRDLLGDGIGDNRAYRPDGTDRPNANILPRHERQANSFAANVLMPRQVIAAIPGPQNVPKLAELFEVSQETMRIHLGE